MIRGAATIRNEHGIHCRPSAVIIKEAAGLRAKVRVEGENGETDLRSITDLLAMGLGPGARVRISVDGPGEAEALETLKELFERRFDFPPREPGQTDESVLRSL